MTMSTIQEFEEAAAKATQASAQAETWSKGPINTTVPTDSGPVPTIAEFTRAAQVRADAAIEALGWVLAGDFTAGCTVTDRNQYVLVVGGPGYRWDGALPKVVTPGSSPTPIATGAWVLVGDATLRGDLAAPGGAGLVGGLAKPVTWSGFAGGADPSGISLSDAAFSAAAAYPFPVSIPDGTYNLSEDVLGDFLEGTAVTYIGGGRAIPKKVGFWSDQGAVRIHRIRDRLFVGNAVQYDGKYAPEDASFLSLAAGYDWLERSAQAHICHQAGGTAFVGSSRTSDKGGMVGQTCIGVAGYAWADDNSGSAWAGYLEGVRSEGVTKNIFGLELTAKNLGTDSVITSPYNIFAPGSTIGLWLPAGGDGSLAPAAAGPSSTAIVIGKNGQRWLKGIQFQSDGLVGTDGDGVGSAVAMEFARGHRLEWRHSALEGDISGGFYSDNQSKSQATYGAITLNGFEVRGVNADQSSEVTLMRVLPFSNAVNFLEVRAGAAGGRPNLAMQGADTNIDLVLTPKGTGTVRPAGSIAPHVTNTLTCGTASNVFAGGFTQAAFTVTSDENYKTKPLEITDEMLGAAAEVDWCMFQYLDRVEAKGEDLARWHFGAMAQRFVEAFERHGLNPFDYAFICYDEWEDQYVQVQTNAGEMVKATRIVDKPVMVEIDGELLPKLVQVYCVDPDDGKPIFNPDGTRKTKLEMVTESVVEEYDTPAPPVYVDVLEVAAGSRYGIRYDQAIILKQKQIERDHKRQLDALESRIADLEAK